MKFNFFQHEKQDELVDVVSLEQKELSDEQLKQVAGGYIIAGPGGELDWLKRLKYAHDHPGTMIPLVARQNG
jgi:bacteriocin-like protein